MKKKVDKRADGNKVLKEDEKWLEYNRKKPDNTHIKKTVERMRQRLRE